MIGDVELEVLTLDRLKSTPVSVAEYVAGVEPDDKRRLHEKNFDEYAPDPDALTEIRRLLDARGESLTLLVIGASWCPDCQRNVPALGKVEAVLDDPRFVVRVLGGVKTRPLKKKRDGKGDKQVVWAVPPSPPEAADPAFDLRKIPTIYLFDREGRLLGRIVENPEHEDTVEGEVLHLLREVWSKRND